MTDVLEALREEIHAGRGISAETAARLSHSGIDDARTSRRRCATVPVPAPAGRCWWTWRSCCCSASTAAAPPAPRGRAGAETAGRPERRWPPTGEIRAVGGAGTFAA
ncbi:hypothetical protein GCM10018962_58520 [Dactylosporangium matsuzakiense]